jgi:hypothetical protein
MSKNAITAALPHSFTRSNPVRIALHDPTQFARLVVGELPGEGEKLCPRDWALLLILKIVEPRHELGGARSGFRYTTLGLVPGIVTMMSRFFDL